MKKIHNLNRLFYISLILSFIIFLLPIEYKMGVYTPNILGWVWLTILTPITLILFQFLLITDIKNKRKKQLFNRCVSFFAIIILSIFYWFYQAIKKGNI